MPRQKPAAPQRLDNEQRQAQQWNLGDHSEENSVANLLAQANDESYDSEEDLDYEPPSFSGAEPTPKPKSVPRSRFGFSSGRKVEVEIEDDILRNLIRGAKFFVPVKIEGKNPPPKVPKKKKMSSKTEWSCTVAKLQFTVVQDQTCPSAEDFIQKMDQEFWIYISDFENQSFVYFEIDSRPRYAILDRLPEVRALEGFTQSAKKMGMVLTLDPSYDWDIDNHRFTIQVKIFEAYLPVFGHPSDVIAKVPHAVHRSFNYFFKPRNLIGNEGHLSDGESEDEDGPVAKPDIDKLYDSIKKYHQSKGHYSDQEDFNPQHKNLLPTLRPYQRHAVQWMLSREKEKPANESVLHPLYEEVETIDGTILYFNRTGGYLVKNKPLLINDLPGGILADEMGLGKTVEVLSCILCNPRSAIEKPDWQEPIIIEKETRKRRKRVRFPSPVEFMIEAKDEKDEKDEKEEKEEKEEKVEKDEKEEKEEKDVNEENDENEDEIQEENDEIEIKEENDENDEIEIKEEIEDETQETIMQVDGNESNSDSEFELENEVSDDDVTGTDPSSSDDDEYVPPAKTSKRNKKLPEDTSDSEEELLAKKWAKQSRKNSKPGPSILKKTRAATKGGASVDLFSNFDPNSVLQGRKVTCKSSLSDKLLFTIAQNQGTDGVSVMIIKRNLDSNFGKVINKKVNKELLTIMEKGFILNTSGRKACSGSFVINPEFDCYDSRKSYISKKLDSIDICIEDVITKVCYDGVPCSESKSAAELELEEKFKAKNPVKSCSTFNKLRQIYEQEMQEMSETLANREKRKKMWQGKFFDTKTEQCDFFECICGVELDEDQDPKHRVQCTSCSLWQHSECVQYDVSDPHRGQYFCPHCWMEKEPVQSGATLIITPSTISHQWLDEIQKHIHNTNIKMLFYKGTKECSYLQPRTLAKYDIVLTTYGVLQSETNYVDLPHTNSSDGRRFRNPKRFMAVPAPLPCINWWRICLDEAQMIENSTSKTAEMALRLKAVNRWCVTGTPIGKSLNDLQGLLQFLQIDPYCMEFWWQRCLCRPYLRGKTQPLEKILSKILWRTAKKDVLNQINIPKQSEEVHWLGFSPIEEHFYRKLSIECSLQMVDKLRNYPQVDMKMSEMDRKSLQTLLTPLLRLRQSCCHPQAVRGQFIGMKSSTMTMEDLLEQMIKKSSVECEDTNRAYIASLSGLAAIDIIELKYADAVEKYRESLRFIEEHKGKVKTDTLQRLHTVVNLSELLEAKHEGIDPTLRDEQLRSEADDLRQTYLKKYSTALEAALNTLQPVTQSVETLRESFQCKVTNKSKTDEGAWYVQVINDVDSAAREDSLLKLVHEEMAQFYDVVNDREFEQIRSRYSNSRLMMVKIFEKVEETDGTRNRVCKELKRIQKRPAEYFLNSAVDCHLRMSNAVQKSKQKCDLCKVHDEIDIYEGILFHFVKGEIKVFEGATRQGLSAEENKNLEDAGVFLHEEQRKGTWADSEMERLLRAILKYSKTKGSQVNPEVIEDGTTHMKMFEALKKEFRLLRILWRQLYDQVAAVDELNMSVMRLRLRFEDEPLTAIGAMKRKQNGPSSSQNLATREKDKFETIYILEPHEVGSQRLKLVSDKTVAFNEFRKKFGQLLYLENLRKSGYANQEGGENPEPCPICQRSLGTHWSVIQCGHCYCVECMKQLIEQFSVGGKKNSVKCAVCRSLTAHSEISFVNTKTENDSELDHQAYESVKGSLSTKIKAVIQTLIRIQMTDPEAKSLVFSTWTDVLDIVASALTENNIQYAALQTQGKFKRNLDKFKNRDDVKVLLLPVTSGANGLNLVSASHVLLVEPILNPAQELQAIGRVHRIGQQKPTVVHRFLIRSTIEEKMYNMLRSYHLDEQEQGSHSTEENVITVQDLRKLFDVE